MSIISACIHIYIFGVTLKLKLHLFSISILKHYFIRIYIILSPYPFRILSPYPFRILYPHTIPRFILISVPHFIPISVPQVRSVSASALQPDTPAWSIIADLDLRSVNSRGVVIVKINCLYIFYSFTIFDE